jgi:hypothetical protein
LRGALQGALSLMLGIGGIATGIEALNAARSRGR